MINKIDEHEEDIRVVYKILNKLEQRIASLEKVLASHAKCIGQLREDKVYIETLNGPELREENNHE